MAVVGGLVIVLILLTPVWINVFDRLDVWYKTRTLPK